ncbi:hypothetical protein Nepgr_001054 [Nepenthes gracilis]|uniref:Uncharacterized protein n=1 Tax=Nepenthes gracilis TaxID=150966 RepID=A0AAD3P5E4_NEPGR|nr:hypothetical protein Nepgr_001054 [Nepenthes gracilis]
MLPLLEVSVEAGDVCCAWCCRRFETVANGLLSGLLQWLAYSCSSCCYCNCIDTLGIAAFWIGGWYLMLILDWHGDGASFSWSTGCICTDIEAPAAQ